MAGRRNNQPMQFFRSDRAAPCIWDSKAPGLGLRATKGGAKAYIFQAKLHGESVRITIGDPRSWTIDKAQEEARRLQTLIDGGIDPREYSAEQRTALEARRAEARRHQVTVGEAWAVYLVYLRTTVSPKTKRARSERYIADHEALASPGGEPKKRGKGLTVAGPLAPLMALTLSELTAWCVAEWLAEEADERPTNAAHAFRLLRAFVHWMAGHDDYQGVVPADACSSPKVLAVLPASNAKEGDCLQCEQLAVWFAAVRQIGNPIIAAYLQGLLLNGPRRTELAALRWDEVDFRTSLSTACAARSARYPSGARYRWAWWRKFRDTSRPRLPKSTTAAVHSTCCVCGTTASRLGCSNRRVSTSSRNKPSRV